MASILLTTSVSGFTERPQQLRQIAVCGCNFRAAVDHIKDMRGEVQRNLRLLQNLRRDECIVMRDDAARIDQAEAFAAIFDLAVNAVAGNAGLIADDGSPVAQDRIEQGRFANVGPPDDDYGWNWFVCTHRLYRVA